MLARVMRRIQAFFAHILVTTTTSGTVGTAYFNQKKGVTLSDGSIVVVAFQPGTNTDAYFYRSTNDGLTWTQYAATIAGYVIGSLATYIDSGGTERLVVVWKQNGTGGSRTDTNTYIMVGAFSGDKSTITWAAHAQVCIGAARDFPDVVTNVEGTGGVAHVTYGYYSGGTTYAMYNKVTISNTGVCTVTGEVTLGGVYNTTVANSYPSIDQDFVSKRLYVAWSAGSAANGIRFKTASYSAGTWTWAAERTVATGFYIESQFSFTSGLVCRFDGNRAVIAGSLYTGSARKTVIWDSTDLITFTNRVNDDVKPSLFGIGMAVDTVTGNVFIFGSTTNGSTYQDLVMAKVVRSGVNLTLDPYKVLDSFVMNATTVANPNVWRWTGKINIVYSRKPTSPYEVHFGKITV